MSEKIKKKNKRKKAPKMEALHEFGAAVSSDTFAADKNPAHIVARTGVEPESAAADMNPAALIRV
ncbi:hypothetical protein [Echinicola vietnamensis]|uniref:Uncharacterized protein n=1 Tax=Echinicola vietnamensis (strain DSM 17526 / LMG 23754 / KMM 6221) TaxID=926556 RepID=L0G0E3_ECHVK|nr:hypothetical protein [Echinicola vietnamensis]AGA79649.1 hypothetical protein Echvi_3430 [Echinicola vietnamensis DSM 17526]